MNNTTTTKPTKPIQPHSKPTTGKKETRVRWPQSCDHLDLVPGCPTCHPPRVRPGVETRSSRRPWDLGARGGVPTTTNQGRA